MNKNVISADDPQALEKLQARLEKLEAKQKEMRAVNAYYRKHKTLDGCPGLPPTGIERLKAKMAHYRTEKPYASYELSGNNAEKENNGQCDSNYGDLGSSFHLFQPPQRKASQYAK